MQSDGPLSENHEPAKQMPAVVPPSGRHIVQLFVVPGAIVFGVVLLFWSISEVIYPWFFGVSRTPHQFLANLENTNPDVRWRAANDLAQVLKRDEQLASDPQFGLRLAEILRQAVAESQRAESSLADLIKDPSRGDAQRERKSFRAQRDYVQFLTACLGTLNTPVGVPLLTELAVKDTYRDAKSNALFRYRVVWALANLGDKRKQFANLSPERRRQVRTLLEEEAETAQGDRAAWARYALTHLEDKQPVGVIPALAKCAESEDPFLRGMTALALTFWEGEGEEKTQAEKTLLRLARDNHWGNPVEIKETD